MLLGFCLRSDFSDGGTLLNNRHVGSWIGLEYVDFLLVSCLMRSRRWILTIFIKDAKKQLKDFKHVGHLWI